MSTKGHSKSSGLPQLPCACATLRRAARAFSQAYDEAIRPSGLRGTQFSLLQVLERMGTATQGQLSRVLAMDSTTLSRTLKLLEDEGWIDIVYGKDRRERHISLTRRGREQLEDATPLWNDVQRRVQAALGKPAWLELMAVLDRATAAVEQA